MLVTLPSNGKQFPENTGSTYFVKLSRAIEMESGDYEVGLVDICFPNSWGNVDTGRITNTITDAQTGRSRDVVYQLRTGRYSSYADLLKDVKRAISTLTSSEDVTVFFDTVRNKGFLRIRKDSMSIRLSADLADILGFETGTSYARGFHTSTRIPDMNRGFNTFYVYCSLAAPRFVGDVQASLLRTVPIGNHPPYTTVSKDFAHVQYTPTGHISTDLVEVNIRRDDGQPVAFGGGKVVLTVDFRRVEK